MWRRLLHSTCGAFNAQKSPLAVLRVKTGYSFSNCKKALELHQNDLIKAEAWLHEQAKADGWGKINLQSRVTQQGLIGIATTRNLAAMVEVNCESDFVARNGKFQDLVALVTESTLYHYIQEHSLEKNGLAKIQISNEDLQGIKCSQSSMGSLTDLVASGTTLTGEKLSLRRGVCYHFNEKSILMGAYCHPPASIRSTMLGKYGSFVFYRQNDSLPPDANISLEELGKQLCLQVIGRNPLELGNRKEIIKEEIERAIELEKKEKEQQMIEQNNLARQRMKEVVQGMGTKEGEQVEQEQQQVIMENDTESDAEESSRDSDFSPAEREKRNKILLLQEYMHDPDYYVWEYLEENGIEVLDFVRFQCGESLD